MNVGNLNPVNRVFIYDRLAGACDPAGIKVALQILRVSRKIQVNECDALQQCGEVQLTLRGDIHE